MESIIGESPTTLMRENQQLPPTSSNLLIMINLILSSPCESLHKSPFIFERTKEAARHNSKIIMDHAGDLDNLMETLKFFIHTLWVYI